MDQGSLCIKDFQIIKQLGSGSFGKVRLVKKKEAQTLYALKSVSLTRLNQKQKDSALNEVRLLASIRIPTVIKYEGSFFNLETQDLCVLMQYADGGDLQQKIVDRDNKMPGEGFEEKYIWKIVYEILQGLKSLHKNNIIHRDIKSANIFFVKGIAKLGDLNVSKVAENGFCTTQTGTPYYTSPQIWQGEKYGNKCDIWSLGCLIYELCCLRHPFKATDFPSLYRKVTKGQYADLPSKYSDKMRSFVRMCLTVDEEMRPSASELLDNSVFQQIQNMMDKIELQEGQVSLVDTIKCPKVLRFLNSRLPKPKNQEQRKKTVNFASKKQIQIQSSKSKQNNLSRRIRSEKIIQWSEEQSLKAPRGPVKNIVKLPPVQKEQTSQKQILGGLHFSTKKLKIKPTSSKLIPQIDKPVSKKLIL